MCRTELTSDRKSAEKRRRGYAEEERSRVVVFDETSFITIRNPEERMQLSEALAVILSTERQVVISLQESDRQVASAASTEPAM
tara:strand:- start:422 stop:673 length:252 start_codon:yes stop_codon:yes gene_type:complete